MKAAAIPLALKIVTVEDSSIIVGRVKDLLDDIAGVQFSGNATSVTEALQLIDMHKPDVVIVDINLGSHEEKNGIDLLIMVRSLYPRIKIIMLTNLTDNRYRVLCQQGGADYFLDKSNDFEKIPDTLTAIMESEGRSDVS
jgi:DNA-binding NarL/FixJ family response regulator